MFCIYNSDLVFSWFWNKNKMPTVKEFSDLFSKLGFEIIEIYGEAFSKPIKTYWNQMQNSTTEITFEKTVVTQLRKI